LRFLTRERILYMSNPIEAVVVGAGGRGFGCYGAYALQHPDEIRMTAVAEPDDARRERFAKAHGVPPERQFRSWEELYEKGRIAQALFNCTIDRHHTESTLPALELGYDMLLEKPMATSLAGNIRLAQAVGNHAGVVMICYVLRYTPFFEKIHEIIASGRLGDIMSMEHRENVPCRHMAHAFVRGNWSNSDLQGPMILSKCCHDMDIVFWNMGRVRRLNSFGSLQHFRAENAPEGAPERCTDGCPVESQCSFSTIREYLGDVTTWPVSEIAVDMSLESRRRALETGPYGRCVYRCDNNVVDNQTVNFEFESGATGTLFMQGHSHLECRTMRYDGTKATLRAHFGGGPAHDSGYSIEIGDHLTGEIEEVELETIAGGHGGGDTALTREFVRVLRDRSSALTSARESLESHLMAFAAEQARVEGSVIEMKDFRRQVEKNV
jgi:predicted dehydrogenase